MQSLSRDQVRAVDRCAIEAVGAAGVVLMENAGRNAADAVERFFFGECGGVGGKAIAIVAGAGNNGGDGYVIARHLVMRGARVVTFLVAAREKIGGDALTNLNIIDKLGHDIRVLSDKAALAGFDVIVDAIGGTGIQGPLRAQMVAAVKQINAAGRPVAAVDIPTGLDCDTGRADGPAIRADMTVTFVARKKGFDEPASREFTGEVIVADVGVPAAVADLARTAHE